MTKKHFIALADTIKNTRPAAEGWIRDQHQRRQQWEYMRDRLTDCCEAQNPRFNRDVFLGYISGTCGPSGGKV